jgi:hypothetical protein
MAAAPDPRLDKLKTERDRARKKAAAERFEAARHGATVPAPGTDQCLGDRNR